MLSKTQRQQITEFAKRKYKNNDRFHGMKHIRNVVAYAMKLASIEKGDKEVCWIAAMLHDIAKYKHRKVDHGIVGAEETKAFLLRIGVGKKTIDGVYDAIYFHNKESRGGAIERQILWDADKLDGSLTFDSFRNRCCPSTKEEKGEKNFIKNAEKDYLFFKKRIHTREGRRIVKRNKPAILRYIEKRKTI